jgi:hypothetical protein
VQLRLGFCLKRLALESPSPFPSFLAFRIGKTLFKTGSGMSLWTGAGRRDLFNFNVNATVMPFALSRLLD